MVRYLAKVIKLAILGSDECNSLAVIKNDGDIDDYDVTSEIDLFQANKRKMQKHKLKEKKIEQGKSPYEIASSYLETADDYTYDELLKFIFLSDQHTATPGNDKPKLILRSPQLLRIGAKKTIFANFFDIAKALHRSPHHLLKFMLVELATSGSLDGNKQLVIKGRLELKHIENVLRRYIKDYVKCRTCCSHETLLQKEKQLFFLNCLNCGANCSVAEIESGFHALTDKRKSIRDKKK